LKSGGNFQVRFKQNYATEVTYNLTCLYAKFGFASSPSAFQLQLRGKCVRRIRTPDVF